MLALVAIAGTNVLTNMFFMTGGASGRLHTLCWIVFGIVAAGGEENPATREAMSTRA